MYLLIHSETPASEYVLEIQLLPLHSISAALNSKLSGKKNFPWQVIGNIISLDIIPSGPPLITQANQNCLNSLAPVSAVFHITGHANYSLPSIILIHAAFIEFYRFCIYTHSIANVNFCLKPFISQINMDSLHLPIKYNFLQKAINRINSFILETPISRYFN